MLKEIIKYRDLLFMLTLRDIRIRYKQAAMGFLWAIFMPIVAVLSGVLVKAAISSISNKPLELIGIISISIKVLPWTFFVSSVKFSVNSLVGNRELITKIYFPREVFPFASILACAFDFLIAMTVLMLFLIFFHIGLNIYLLWFPVILFLLFLFTAGISLFLSSANLFLRDVKYIVEIILMFGIFFTPVFYDVNTFPKWKYLLLLNPLGGLLEAINSTVALHSMPDIFWLSYSAIMAIFTFIIGLTFFRKTEPYFAENI
jgi:ABC-type polysaccharide/polyol phosphate export permease